MKTRQYFIAILSLFFFACGGDSKLLCKEEELVEAPPEFLRYWYFPKGSWWVYQLQDTVGVYDTMCVVSDYKRYCNRDGASDPDCDQAPCTWMYSNTWRHSDTTFFYWNPNYLPEHYNSSYNLGNYWVVQGGGGGGTYAPPYPFVYPFTIGEKYMGNNEIVSEDSIETPVGVFARTLHIIPDKFQLDSTINKYVQHLYISPDVGVVKWHYTHHRVWELIAYDVTP
ncbi:MAG: hypothetical protein K1X92_08610 [Bacteroidia bacterium]|nr:hypothetical protein [Bacteroidia bacterium]